MRDSSMTIPAVTAFNNTSSPLIGGGTSYSYSSSMDEVAFFTTVRCRASTSGSISLQGLKQIASIEKPANRQVSRCEWTIQTV